MQSQDSTNGQPNLRMDTKTGEILCQKANITGTIIATKDVYKRQNVKTQTDIANQAQRNVTDTATILKASMENLLGGLQQISSGGLYNACLLYTSRCV